MNPQDIRNLDLLIRHRVPFAAYRLPGTDAIRLVAQTSGPEDCLQSMSELEGQRGFVFAPFAPSAERPVVLIREEHSEIPIVDELGKKHGDRKETTTPSLAEMRSAYPSLFECFMRPLVEGRFHKLVLTRDISVMRPADFSPASAFARACGCYPHSFAYLCHTETTGTWLGCSPELMLSSHDGMAKTVALAGTRRTQSDDSPSWDGKNIDEQELVADHIRLRLREAGISFAETGPFPADTGHLMHLKTEFRFPIDNADHIPGLLTRLHPTPAVCGLPSRDAFEFIRQYEGYDRQYYTGIIGMLDEQGDTDLYVNLRCMRIGADELTLYAGGGLMPSSVMESELGELEDKLQTMLSLIK